MTALAVRAARLLGEDLVGCEAVSGGSLSSVTRAVLASGSSVVVKSGSDCRTEAQMLEAIRASGAPAPQVLAVAHDVLVLEDLGHASGLGAAWGALGRAVRTLHGCVGSGYGWSVDYAFGSVPIHNQTGDDWPRFWGEQRLRSGAAGLSPSVARRIEALCQSLPDRLPSDPHPVLLHGDLWSGNIVARGQSVQGLVDPACYYGHNEVDLAMLCLFASPDASFWAEYGHQHAPGFEERRAIYQLWPALVHLRLFGDVYLGLVERLLTRCRV